MSGGINKAIATTYVICPVGTTIELYRDKPLPVGKVFDVYHIDTKKVVQRARVTSSVYHSVEAGRKYYRVLAEIIA